ncbi:huntingtin [Galleria mellonella]|uniref:Huntingtin n=1 Tax=Galleria mellonella TaxID=7137 RepID=A0ABM3MN18_GALME|nr:huntingtin [Galleria mellonella]
MNLLEKAEKALEYLKANDGSTKSHDLQSAAGTLGRCLGALGSRPNFAKHYANLLHTAIPTLLSLASNNSAEVRLVGDEALNRAVVGGFAFHSHKTNIILQNYIDTTRNARWIRSALTRICLGDSWLRPGTGKIRSQAQTLIPKLSQIVQQTSEIQLIVEALENNLSRILTALAEYTTDEEMSDLSKALLSHVESTEPAVRRGVSSCVAYLCSHREPLLTNILGRVFEKLWPMSSESTTIMGWFCVVKAIFQINDISKFNDNELFTVQDYLELYHLCIHYIEQCAEHNIQNCVMECLTVLLTHATGNFRRALLDKHPHIICLDDRQSDKGHKRNISSVSIVSTRYVPSPSSEPLNTLELSFTGELQLGSLLQLNTPSLSVEDLSIQTPESPASEPDVQLPNTEDLTKEVSEKLQEYGECDDKDYDQVDQPQDIGFKINIGSSTDDDVPLRYCSRLLASKYLLTGNKGELIHDRSVRVSVKASALNCLSEILHLYPQAITMYLDKDADMKNHNISGSSEGTDMHQEHINDFILERNVCYQDSSSDSMSQDFLNRSMDSQQTSNSQQMSKKESKSLEKSIDSEQKSSTKDVPSAILDSKYAKSDMAMSIDSTNPNMTNSNFTTNSNLTGSTWYPMSSSGDVLSSSIDLDMKFDHFGESPTNLDNLDALKELEKKEDRPKRPLRRTVAKKEDEKDLKVEEVVEVVERDFVFQHMSDIFVLLEGHNDPQIRGLVRVCIGKYLSAALDLSHGDYHRWRNFAVLPKDVSSNISTEKLVGIVLKGLSDDIHSTVNHTLSALTNIASALCTSTHWFLLVDALNSLVAVENNGYWLCRVNLCKFYEKLPYQRLFILYAGYHIKSKVIMDTLIRLLADQDQKVRKAAAEAIVNIIPRIYPPKRSTPITMVADMAKEHSQKFIFDQNKLSLDLVRNMYFYSDLPDQLRSGDVISNMDSLRIVVADLLSRTMSSSCKYYTQGLLETLQAICKKWSPWKHVDAYSEQGILSYCLDSLDYCNGTVAARTVLLNLCAAVYPVEIHNVMKNKTFNRDIFERDSSNVRQRWQHLENEKVSNLAEKFLQVTLKMLNVLVHLIEEVNPNVHLNKGGIALPGSPVRRKTQESIPRKASNAGEAVDEKGSLRKKVPVPATSLKANFAGHFYTEMFYMRFYETLRATYSNHKINLDPKNSMFHDFLSTVLDCLAIQLELATEKEFGPVTEEILYYLKVIMPLRPDTTVYCVTQLLKCLFGTNMISQYPDFMSICDKIEAKDKTSFFHDVMLINSLNTIDKSSRRSSVCSNASQKLSLDSKNPRMMEERQMLIAMENFSKNKTDRKWSTNKKELERYIRLFEPVVIQSLKGYTMQNDIPLQCKVLCLLNQLLTLRVNYCMLDSDQVFIGFLMKQLDLVEQHEIPNCCDLVYNILLFLVQLSSSKHHTKQIIEIPKLIQLCDGLMASGAHLECIAGLEPVAVKVFSSMGSTTVLGRAQQQEAQATREVLFYMLQKTMHQHKVLDLVSCVLSLSQEHPESYYRWSELATDTLLNLLTQRTIEIDSTEAISSLERLLDSIYKDVLLEPTRVEILMKILFKAPPDQATTPAKFKLRYLSIIMVLLRKVLILIPESEILLTINDLKASSLSPQSIFFNVKPDVDPLNVQNVNENCANLSPDVVLVRLLFKTLTYVIIEMDGCYDTNFDSSNLDPENIGSKVRNDKLLYSVCVNIIVQVKHMLHLTNGCLFPLTAKTAQTILHNEQSGLNTGLYSPDENIPLDLLNLICLRSAHRVPLLTVHWSHLLIRLNFLTHKYWQKLIGFARNLPLRADSADKQLLRVDLLQIACVMAYCEYFVENGLSEVVHLTWLLVNRGHILISQYKESVVQSLISKVQQTDSASGLFLQAIAARCQNYLKDEFALNTYKILSLCHESESGALIFFICRIIGKQEPAIAVRFAKLAIERCGMLKELSEDKINEQLSKEDVQIALEMLQRDQAHVRYPSLVMELNSLASTVFALSPLDLSQDRAVNPQYISTTNVDSNWLLNQVKSRCCQKDSTARKANNQHDLALLMSNLSQEELTAVTSCPEFDRKILGSCFKISSDSYIREFLNVVSIYESKEIEKDRIKEHMEMKRMREEMTSSVDSNKLNVVNTLHVFKRSDSKESKSQFFIPITESENVKENFGNLELSDEETELVLPELSELYRTAVATFDKSLTDVIRLFPKQNRPLSQSENFSLNIEQSIDRYTRRCHQVFQDKLFYQEYTTLHTILTGYLDALNRLIGTIDETDCDLLEKIIEIILPSSLSKNIAIFSVMSLQYLSFLIKNKEIVESPIHTDVSFRTTDVVTENIVIDNVILITVDNVAKALSFQEIWNELNASNMNKAQSAISCLYAVVKYLVKDTKPLVLNHYIQPQDSGPTSDMIIIGDKLISLISYWEQNFYSKPNCVLGNCYAKHIESLLVSLSRLHVVSNMALIPPIAWSSVDVTSKKDQPLKIDLPLQALQDMDVLEAFLFRVNLISWSSKKQFEEIWVALLGALQGNGTHWAIMGITELILSTVPRVRTKGMLHVPRSRLHVSNGMQTLRNLVVGTSAYKIFECVNLERIPLMNDGYNGYHYAQFNAEYLKLASDLTDEASFKVRQDVKRTKMNRDLDVNSCLQILMDVATQMLEPKAGTGTAARVALVRCVAAAAGAFAAPAPWCWAGGLLLRAAAHRALAHYAAAARALLLALATCLCVLHRVDGLQVRTTAPPHHRTPWCWAGGLLLRAAAHRALAHYAAAARALLLALATCLCVLHRVDGLQVRTTAPPHHRTPWCWAGGLLLRAAAHRALAHYAAAARALLLALATCLCVLHRVDGLQVRTTAPPHHRTPWCWAGGLLLRAAAHRALAHYAAAARALLLALATCLCVLHRVDGLQVRTTAPPHHRTPWCWAGGLLLRAAAHRALAHYAAAARALLLALATCLCVLHRVDGLQELTTVHQKLLKSLTSSYAPLRQAALQGCLLQLSSKPVFVQPGVPNPFQELVAQLNVAVRLNLTPNCKISLYEQSLYWTVLFTLIELGHPDLINVAVDFLLTHPRHYCGDLVVKGICTTIRQQVLPKDLKNTVIERLLDNMKSYCEHHAVQILMVHLFSADNKLLSPKLTSDVSNMDPDVLMSSMERITLLYKTLRQVRNKESKTLLTSAMKYFLRETLPPAATLSRVVIEFLETCKDAEKMKLSVINDRGRWIEGAVLNAQIVFEVFEAAVSQDQLPVLSGWIFEALCHLLNGKVSPTLLPYCVTTLLVSASPNQFIRKVAPLCFSILRTGFQKSVEKEIAWGIFRNFLSSSEGVMSFTDRRLMCVASTHSNFSGSQLERLKELCEKNDCLEDVLRCLNL